MSKSEKQIISMLAKRIKAQERLLIAYRVGGRPPGKSLDDLSATSRWEQELELHRKEKP